MGFTAAEADALCLRAGAPLPGAGKSSATGRPSAPPKPVPIATPFRELIVLWGHCPSKKNAWRRREAGKMIIEPEVKRQIETLTAQAMLRWAAIWKQDTAPVDHPNLTIKFIVRAQRQDRDGMLTTVLDCLQAAGVLVNDNIAHCNGIMTIEPCEVFSEADERVEVWIEKVAA